MPERFLISDTHFSQPSMCAFANDNGTPLRPWGRAVPEWKTMTEEERADLLPEFEQRAAEMDEAMIENWNRVVGPKDRVNHLGDVVMARRHLPILARLNGKKRLLLGNHDPFLKDYPKYFDEVGAYKIMVEQRMILSHIPIQEDSLKKDWTNVHGHLHNGRVMASSPVTGERHGVPNRRYLCVSVELIDYTPISIDEVVKRIATQQEGGLESEA